MSVPRWPARECLHERYELGGQLTNGAGVVLRAEPDVCVDCRAELLCPSKSDAGDRCAHLSNHAGRHGATNAAGAISVEWD